MEYTQGRHCMKLHNKMQVPLCICTTVFIFVILSIKNVHVDGFTDKSEWTQPPHDMNMVCYVGTWANYRPSPGRFLIDNIDPSLCTHLIYTFVGLDNDTLEMISLDEWTDLDNDEGGRGGFRKMTGLKVDNPHLKVLLAVGGYNEGSEKYSRMVESVITRNVFIESALQFIQKYEFDGLDLDWEYPTKRGGHPDDTENFVSLLGELRLEFDKHNLILTAAISAGPDTIKAAYDIPALRDNLDLINVMTYDYHGSWDNFTGSNAPLYTQEDLFSVEDTLTYLREAGAPMEKITLGLPTYGHTFIMDDPTAEESQKLGASSQFQGFAGPYTRQNGFYGYNEICLEMQDPKWTRYWDDTTSTPYMIASEKLISYDNEESIALKVKYGLAFGVGGFMVWSIDTDDFLGDCGGGRYPLLHKITTTILTKIKPFAATSSSSTTKTSSSTTKTSTISTTTTTKSTSSTPSTTGTGSTSTTTTKKPGGAASVTAASLVYFIVLTLVLLNL